jgi:hypothetical protein
MNKQIFLALLAFAALASLLRAQEATIARLAGAETVTVTLPSGEEAMMGQGDVIPVGSWVEVPQGKLFLRTFQGTVSVFSSGAIFEITEIEQAAGMEKTRLTLQSGDMVANLDPNKRDVNDYGVITPKGVAAARGTNYTVSVNGQDVVVTVVAGVVSVNIPDVGLVALNSGQASTGGAATSIAAVLTGGNAANATAARNALQAAAAAVSALASTGTDGVTAATLSSVIAVAGDVANETGDDSVLTQATAAAVVASPSNAQTVVRAAVARRPAAAQAIVASATQAAVAGAEDSGASVDAIAQELSDAANETLSEAGEDTGTTVDSGQVTEDVESEDPVVEEAPEIENPNDNIENPVSVTFTIRLSGGRFVTVTLNDVDDEAEVSASNAIVGAATTQIGDGSEVTFDVPATVIAELGNLTPGQRSNITTGIREVLGDLPVIAVPNNTITVSPSS